MAQLPTEKRDGNLLRSVTNGRIVGSGTQLRIERLNPSAPIQLDFATDRVLGISRESGQWWVLPLTPEQKSVTANTSLWVLPDEPGSSDGSWRLEFPDKTATATVTGTGVHVEIATTSIAVTKAESRPHSDTAGNRFSIQMDGGAALENALAGFYWGTMLPSVVERTMAANYPYSSGYVLSTLNTKAYAGSYPAVDHEFQTRGRMAMGSDLDLDVVRRIIELQFRLMNDDPEHLFRAPCSVQPDGTREYHIRRNSLDNRTNAAMFPVTGNIEVLEEAWHYVQATKSTVWLRTNIATLEYAASWTESHVDAYGRLWSDVYYEDQVMEDGRTTEGQAFAARTFSFLAQMERMLGRNGASTHYRNLSSRMAKALVQPLPLGYWDEKSRRFIDWVDRNSRAHDHVHLLANVLPVTFGYATAEQVAAVRQTVAKNAEEFERFPSFLAADVAGYTRSEIGDGGPYDLSAAGRYWYWDAAYRATQNENSLLAQQLRTVAAEAAKSGYFMGERYDMDHVYYIDGKDAHGAEKYYEYPNVFASVLIARFLGLGRPAGADLSVAPHLDGFGSVEFDTPAYAVRYTFDAEGFTLTNLAGKPRQFLVDMSSLKSNGGRFHLDKPASKSSGVWKLTLAPGEQARWSVRKPIKALPTTNAR